MNHFIVERAISSAVSAIVVGIIQRHSFAMKLKMILRNFTEWVLERERVVERGKNSKTKTRRCYHAFRAMPGYVF